MPLTKKGRSILDDMREYYEKKKHRKKGTAESVFYASINKGKITGAEKGGH